MPNITSLCEVCNEHQDTTKLRGDDYMICDDCYDELEDQSGYCSVRCMVTKCCDQTC